MNNYGRVSKITVNRSNERAKPRSLVTIPTDIAEAIRQMGANFLGWELCKNGDIKLHLLTEPDDALESDAGVSLAEWVKEA